MSKLTDLIPELNDEQQVRFLYGPLPKDRSIQPENYDRKVSFWEKAVRKAVANGLLPHSDSRLKVSSGFQHRLAFASKDGHVPICWSSLFQVWEKQGKIVAIKDWKRRCVNSNNESAASSIISSTLSAVWTWPTSILSSLFGDSNNNSLQSSLSPVSTNKFDDEEGQVFVLLDEVKELEAAVLKEPIPVSVFDQCLKMDDLVKDWLPKALEKQGYPGISHTDCSILVDYMVQQKSIVLLGSDGQTCLKPGIKNISIPLETARNVLHIQGTITLLQTQISSLTQRIQTLKKSVKDYLSKGMKSRALLDLRLSKSLESLLEQRCKALENLELVYLKIESSETDAQILNTYEIGSKTIESLLKDYGINADKVHETMDHLEDVLADQREIDLAMKRSISSDADNVDDDELEKELNLLVAAQEVDRATSPKTLLLPPVATTTLKKDFSTEDIDDELLERIERLKLKQIPSSSSKEPAAVDGEEEEEEEEERVLVPA